MEASIDLGSNSVLLTILDQGRVVHDEARVVGLGRGVDDGKPFREDRKAATLDALKAYAGMVKAHGVPAHLTVCGTTSAARRASDAKEFLATIESETGFQFRVLSGDEEAVRTFLGARSGLDVEGRTLVVDLGGGSTELAMGVDRPDWFHSHELGSVRLTEGVLGEDVRVARPADLLRLREQVSLVLAEVEPPGMPDHVVGVAGSVTTLAGVVAGLTEFDAHALHGAVLRDAELAGVEASLLGMNADERRRFASFAPDRADYLLAACVVLRAVLAVAGESSMVVSTRGLRYGLLQPIPAFEDPHTMQSLS